MTQVKNSGQELEVIRGGVSTYYNYSSFKTISWFQANNGNYVVVINFLTDAGGNVPLRISLNEVDNQPGWTNDPIGVANAVKDIAAFSGATIENIEALVASINGTLTSILATLQNGSDWEAYIVKDSDTPSVLWLEVRTYDPNTSTWSIEYFLPGSTTPGSPVLPVIYESPNSLLALMLAELVAQTASLSNIDTSTAGILSELQTGVIDVNLTSTIAVPVTDNGGSLTIDAVSLPLPTGAATETTIGAVNTKLTPSVRTHNTVSATGAGSVPAGSLRGSVINAGSAAGTWNGISLPAGVALPWDAVGPRDTYGAIAYNATGTTFIIEYTT